MQAQTTQIGIVSPVVKGEWDSTVTYNKLNIVTHNGVSFIAYGTVTGIVEPGVTAGWESYWMKLSTSPLPMGEWNSTTTYPYLAIVTLDGSSYIANEENYNKNPATSSAWQLIAEKGDDGGFSPTAKVEQTADGAVITITDKSGTTTATVTDGKDGKNGTNGTDGTDGVSPTVATQAITGGTKVTITDKDGAHEFNVMNGTNGTNGKDGTDGTDGTDGITPTIGANGNWYLGNTDTGKPSRGATGGTGATGAAGKSAYEYAQDGGYTGTETEFSTDINPDNIKGDLNTYIAEELAKRGQLKPEFANSIEELNASGDTTKVYVLPDGYIYGYINGVWTNTGHKFVSIETLNKVIDATCDIHTATGVNYNLLKPSQLLYKTRLQDDLPDPIASSINNLVTNWIPVTYGKYYTPSSLYGGKRVTYKVGLTRVNLKLTDDTIIPYATLSYPYAIDAQHNTVGVANANAVAMRFQLQVVGEGGKSQDISTSDKFKAFEPMIVEGDTALDSYNKALSLAYLDGDAEAPTVVDYTLKHEQEFITIQNNLEKVSPVRFDFKHELADVSQYLTDSGYTSLNTVRTTTETAFNALVETYPDYVSSEDAAVRVGLSYPSYANYTTKLYKFIGSSFTGRTRGKILLYAGAHGNEPGAVVNCYIFMRKLIDTLVTDANAYKLFQNFDFYVLPCLNGKGLDDVTRYNGNGVDINRNFPTSGWVSKGQPYERGYTGASAGSEFETQLIMKLVDDIKPDIIIDHHSYGNDGIQFYNSFAYSDIRTLMFRSYDDCIVAFKKNLPQYFGNGFNKIDGILSSSDVGHSPVWFKENGLLGGCVEISMNINYLNGIATSGKRDWMGSTTMSIAEYTLSNHIMRLAEKYTL